MRKVFDNTQAFREGWGLFMCDDGLLRVQRLDHPQSVHPKDAPVFATDDEAIIWVAEQGRVGSRYHARACALHGTTGGDAAVSVQWNPADPIATWLALGEQNRWIRRACDPPFTRRSFVACADAAELKRWLSHGNWCVGSAFFLCDLCFIEQQAGAGEWLVIKQNVAFESASCGDMIDAGTFDAFLADVQAATTEQCAALKYRR